MFNDRQGGWQGGQLAGLMRPHAMQTGGYDSSGINPSAGMQGQMPGQINTSQYQMPHFQMPPRPQGFSPVPMRQSYGGQPAPTGYDSSGINPGGQSYGQMPQGQMQRPMYGQALMGQQYPMGGLAGMWGRWGG